MFKLSPIKGSSWPRSFLCFVITTLDILESILASWQQHHPLFINLSSSSILKHRLLSFEDFRFLWVKHHSLIPSTYIGCLLCATHRFGSWAYSREQSRPDLCHILYSLHSGQGRQTKKNKTKTSQWCSVSQVDSATEGPGWCVSVDWALACKPKGSIPSQGTCLGCGPGPQ